MGNCYALSDGTSVVSFYPEWNIKQDPRKVETSHRTRSGANYRYIWGTYKHCKFDAHYLSSADMCRINSWWGSNTPVVLYDLNSTAVISGYLVGNSAPVDELVKPYYDQFKATIEMESF